MPLQYFKNALERGNYSGFINYNYRTYKKGLDIEEIVYCGSRKKTLRIYPTEKQHGIDAIRLEGQYREQHARAIFEALAPVEEFPGGFWTEAQQQNLFHETETASHLANIVASSFDFIRKTSKNLERNHRLLWWAEFITQIGKGKFFFAIPKPVKTFQKTIDWVERQVGRSLTYLYLAFGNDFQTYVEEIAAYYLEERFDENDENMLRQLLSEIEKNTLDVRGLYPKFSD